MQSLTRLITIIFITAFSLSCSANSANNANAGNSNQAVNSANSNINSNSVKNEIEELEMLVNLPFHPEDVDYVEDRSDKSNEKKLTAVLLFTKEDADKLAAQAEKIKPPTDAAIIPEKWFPAELIAQSQTSGDETLKGKSYAANDFFNAPYTDGKLTRIEGTDYFVLELSAK